MKPKLPVRILLLMLLAHNPVASQIASSKINTVNQFNFLFGDYFTVDLEGRISSTCNDSLDFRNFYSTIKNHWNNAVGDNLDDNPFLQSKHKIVRKSDIVINRNGFAYPRWMTTDDISDMKVAFNKPKLMATSDSSKSQAFIQSFGQKASTALQESTKKTIIFFIHGYNVPYSLAHLQSNRIVALLDSSGLENNTLFFRVLWDGGNRKKLNIKVKEKNGKVILKQLTYKDVLTLRNATGFNKRINYSRACGLTLREFMNSILKQAGNDSLSFKIITHSLGANVAASCLLNNAYVLPFKGKKVRKMAESINYQLDSLLLPKNISLLKKRKANRALIPVLEKMRKVPLPNAKVDVFMNAPAIAGVKSFLYHDTDKNYSFTVGYNRFDPVLDKRFLSKNITLFSFGPKKFGATTLGLNYQNECRKTALLFSNSKVKFTAVESGNYFEHDLFYYSQGPEFVKQLKTLLSTK